MLGEERFLVTMARSEAVVSRSLFNKHTCKLRLVDDLTCAARIMKILVMVMVVKMMVMVVIVKVEITMKLSQRK